MNKKTIKLGWLYPSTLYLHGERGNILAFKDLASKSDINLDITEIELNNQFSPLDFDILYCPAGELVRTDSIIKSLEPVKEELKDFINQGRPLVVTGNSINYFTNQINRVNNDKIKGLGIIDVISTENNKVYGDDIYFNTTYNGKPMEIFGNQIQMADFNIKNEKPFGKIKYGYGNNGNDINEGVLLNNSIFTNTLGPLFILNPWLTLEVLNIALKNKGLDEIPNKKDFELEKKSLKSKINYLKNKKTNLKNTDKLE